MTNTPTREQMECDVLIIGAGPAGLSCAIRLAQLATEQQRDLSIFVLEKGQSVGAHIISGAVFEPQALNQLLPDWEQLDAPIHTPTTNDKFMLLTKKRAWRLPTPPQMHNSGNFIISLSELCIWLAQQAEQLGISIFPGFAGSKLIFNGQNELIGVGTGDMGLDKDGQPTDRFQPGVDILAKQTVIAEGCHGSLAQELISHYALRQPSKTQTYGLGIKELWEIPRSQHQKGLVWHSVGWPLPTDTYGGSFMYHFDDNKVAIGFVVGLDYSNPYLDPFKEFQLFKTHSVISKVLKDGERIGYGARALVEGGIQSLPKLSFPGGLIIGDSAGFLNVPKIKGSHNAMQSGIIAAETIMSNELQTASLLNNYDTRIKISNIYKELRSVRNVRPGFRWGLWGGLINAAIDTYLFRGHAPWTLHHKVPDNQSLKKAKQCKPRHYIKPDNKLTFDKLSSVYLANTQHREDQPTHLILKQPELAISVNQKLYASPETHYCPAAVYEVIHSKDNTRLQINASNCVHCKTCDIKDPKQNIKWTPPEGGSGPNYEGM